MTDDEATELKAALSYLTDFRPTLIGLVDSRLSELKAEMLALAWHEGRKAGLKAARDLDA